MPETTQSMSAGRREQYGDGSTAKGKRTREALTHAAREVFARDGFVHARIADIADGAGVSHGSFYTYFESKQAILVEILREVAEDVQAAVAHSADDLPGDAIGNLERSTRRYVEAYRRNAPMYVLMEQLVGIDEVVRKIRLRGRRSHAKRVTERIRLQQERGLADPGIDASIAGAALASMISNYCYWAYLTGDEPDLERVVDTLSGMWARAVGLRATPRRRGKAA